MANGKRKWILPVVVIGLLVVGGIIVFILFLTRKHAHKDHTHPAHTHPAHVGNWSQQQKADFYQAMMGTGTIAQNLPNTIRSCIVDEVAKNYSYSQASSANFDHKPTLTKCLGVKGSWKPGFQTAVVQEIIAESIAESKTGKRLFPYSATCATCIAKHLEKQVDPLVFVDPSKKAKQAMKALVAYIARWMCMKPCHIVI